MIKITGFLLLLINLLLFELQPLLAQGGSRAVNPDSPVVSFGPTPKEALLVGEKAAGRLKCVKVRRETIDEKLTLVSGWRLVQSS